MSFSQLKTHKHYTIAFKKILKKGQDANSNINDVISTTLVVIRLTKD
jgi:hypothetical protein